MRGLGLFAIGFFVAALAGSPCVAQQRTYSLTVELTATNGSQLSSNTFICPLFDKCQNTIAATFDGKPQKIGVRSFLTDDHHIRVMLRGNALIGGPFNDIVADKAFVSGNEWTYQLSKLGPGMTTLKQGTARITLTQ
jgi:hypothetical protein